MREQRRPVLVDERWQAQLVWFGYEQHATEVSRVGAPLQLVHSRRHVPEWQVGQKYKTVSGRIGKVDEEVVVSPDAVRPEFGADSRKGVMCERQQIRVQHLGIDAIFIHFGQTRLGVKSGRGFYRYEGKKKTVHAEALAKLRQDLNDEYVAAGSSRIAAKLTNDQMKEAQERMVCLMVNEAAACLAEGLAASADVIDLAMVLGTGWAPHRGGPLHYAAERGLAEIVRKLEDMSRRWGPRFEPCSELRRRVTAKESFANRLAEALPV